LKGLKVSVLVSSSLRSRPTVYIHARIVTCVLCTMTTIRLSLYYIAATCSGSGDQHITPHPRRYCNAPSVCLLVCLSVNRITQQIYDDFHETVCACATTAIDRTH